MEVLVGLGVDEEDAHERMAEGKVVFPTQATDAAVIAIVERCAGLKAIDLSSCSNITDAAVIALAERCAGLKEIDLRYCSNITDAAVIALVERCAYMEFVSCLLTKVSGTVEQLLDEAIARPKPPPLPEGWWLEDDGVGAPSLKGHIN